jgi:hypothetical protein
MRLAPLIGAALAVLCVNAARATVLIDGDPVGQIGPYVARYMTIRQSGERVVIDGPCLSACTMVLGILPRTQVCVTPKAVLGFHAAWRPDAAGKKVTSAGGTQLLWDVYPKHIRRWITRKGGLSPHMIMLRGRELASMYPSCGNGGPAGTEAVRVRPTSDDMAAGDRVRTRGSSTPAR